MAEGNIPGAAVGVVQGERVTWAAGFGVTSVEDGGVAVTPSTLFRIGSTTKIFTGLVLMQLVAEGLVELDRPVVNYLKEFKLSDPAATGRVTLRHLMSHRSGLPAGAEHHGKRDPSALEEFVRDELPGLNLVAEPGRGFCYSNPGVDVAGYIAQVIAGTPYHELVKERIFDPLGMERTTFDPTVAMTYPLAQSHYIDSETGDLKVLHQTADNYREYPAGFIFSTIDDMTRLLRALLKGGSWEGATVADPATLAEMSQPLGFPFGKLGGYGLTLQVGEHKGRRRLGHNGAISTFVSAFDFYPDDHFGVVVLMSRGSEKLGPEELAMRLADAALGLEPGPPATSAPQPVDPDRSRWPDYTGRFVGQYTGIATISIEADELVLEMAGDGKPLTCVAEDTYVPFTDGRPTGLVYFIPSEEGPVEWIQLHGMPSRRTDTDPSDSPELKAEESRSDQIAGTYAGGGFTVRVSARGPDLWIESDELDPPLLATSVGSGRFETDLGLLDFVRGEHGQADRIRLAGFEVARL